MEENLCVCKDATSVMQLWKWMASSQDILNQVVLSQTRITATIREDKCKNCLEILYAGLVVSI